MSSERVRTDLDCIRAAGRRFPRYHQSCWRSVLAFRLLHIQTPAERRLFFFRYKEVKHRPVSRRLSLLHQSFA